MIDTAFFLRPKSEMDVRWAYYELLTQNINEMDSGSAIPSTSRDEFYGLPVLVPPLPEQRAIASLKERKGDPVKAELDIAMKRIGELIMQVELLEAKTETSGPLGRRRSRR